MGLTTRQVERVVGVDGQSLFADLFPLRAGAIREVEGQRGNGLKGLGIASLGVDVKQFVMNRHPLRAGAQGIFQDFFGLKVTAIGPVSYTHLDVYKRQSTSCVDKREYPVVTSIYAPFISQQAAMGRNWRCRSARPPAWVD